MKTTKEQLRKGRRLARVYRKAQKELEVCIADTLCSSKYAGCWSAISVAMNYDSEAHYVRDVFAEIFHDGYPSSRYWRDTREDIGDIDDETINRLATPRIIALELAALMAEEGQLT